MACIIIDVSSFAKVLRLTTDDERGIKKSKIVSRAYGREEAHNRYTAKDSKFDEVPKLLLGSVLTSSYRWVDAPLFKSVRQSFLSNLKGRVGTRRESSPNLDDRKGRQCT
jgi:hypothetical protein